MNQTPNHLNEDLLTRWVDGHLTPEEAALVAEQSAQAPELLREKQAAAHIGALLREHLPVSLEPPSPEFFTSSIMEEIRRELPAAPVKAARPSRLPEWLRAPWFAPVASAAAVAVAFLAWNHRVAPAPSGLFAQAYTPDPKITANSYYSEEAEATVIDLQNLDAVPDEHEIKAFDVASAETSAPGMPRVFYAARDASRPVFILSKDGRETPRVSVVY